MILSRRQMFRVLLLMGLCSLAACLHQANTDAASLNRNALNTLVNQHGNVPANAVVLVMQDPRPLHRQRALGSPAYSNRLAYDDDPLLDRTAKRIAKEMGSEFLFQWPIRSQKLLCVVVKSDDARRLIAQAPKDRRILMAQRFNSFDTLAEHEASIAPAKPQTALAQAASFSRENANAIKILIIDTSADAQHEDLAGAQFSQQDFVGKQLGFHPEMHGTGVVGVVAAQSMNGLGIAGLAPYSNISLARACWQLKATEGKAKCNTLTLTAALDFALQEHFDLINLSLSGPVDPLLELMIDKLLAQGTVIVTAFDPNRPRIERFPKWRAEGGVLFAVGSETTLASPRDANGEDANTGGANTASVAELAAWEVSAPYSAITLQPGNSYDVVSGHSIASPHVVGRAAHFLAATPEMKSEEVLVKLKTAGAVLQPVLEN